MCAEMHLDSITHACGWLCCNQMLTGVAAPQAARPEMEVLMKWLKERQASAGVSPHAWLCSRVLGSLLQSSAIRA